ncbi:unnamed protein product [marine sediment metagenome]|uniref:Uncharacterized protein n=1 Tax=marine sediment metagenome TaxID=412755 RepID=X1AVK8_9ZZZZ
MKSNSYKDNIHIVLFINIQMFVFWSGGNEIMNPKSNLGLTS